MMNNINSNNPFVINSYKSIPLTEIIERIKTRREAEFFCLLNGNFIN